VLGSRGGLFSVAGANVWLNRTLVYLEGDATMRNYEDADGKKQSALSLVQTKVEVLKRPVPKEEEAAGL